jgi:TonB-linked SusC/RagA family outer membrane protein
MSKSNAPLKSVLKEIRTQSGYNFIYTERIFEHARPVNIDVKATELDAVLREVFKDQPLSYSIDQKTIIVKVKEDAFFEKVVDRFQAIDVRGRVVDSLGNGLPGASVSVKKSKGSTMTNANGEFYLPNVDENAVLVISYVGYNSRELSADANIGDVVLTMSDSKLDEVQVIAYGTQQKKFSTNTIATVTAKEIARQPVSNPLLALQGRVPGLFIKQGSGVTASNVTVNVQGVNSLSNGSDPFYVIDGVPYTPQFTDYSLMGGAMSGSGGSTFNFINPADIESISILKDADATAIYGSRAANGAILITTKKGKAGKTKIDFNIQNGWGQITRKLELLSTQQYLEIRKEAYTNAGQTVPTSASNPTTSNYDLTVWDQNRYTDWQDILVGGTAKFTDLQGSVSGGSNTTQFVVSYGYHKETTVYPGDLADIKGNVRFNLDHTSPDHKFKYSLSGTYLEDKNTLNSEDLMGRAVLLAPNAPALYKDDGSINWQPLPNNPNISSFRSNPIPLYVTTKYSSKASNLLANNSISYEITPGLILKSTMGFNRLNGNENKILPIAAFRPELATKTRQASYLTKSITSWILEPQLSYTKSFQKSIFDLLIGSTFQQNKSDVLGLTGSGYSSDAQLQNPAAATTVSVNNVSQLLYKYSAVFGRLNYRLLDKYIVNLTARRDGSSRFGSENKFNNFYSVGAAWLFADEDFFKNTLPFISYGKLRGNYGTTGNDQITDYRYLSSLDPYLVDIPYFQTVGLYPTNIANPLLQWEETRKLNFGLDLGILKNKILLNLSYYRNRSSNQLIGYILPSITGFDRIDRNFPATIQNTGLEIQLDVAVLKNKLFSWQSSFNLTIPKNKLVAFPALEESSYASNYILGKSVNIRQLFQFEGVNKTTGLYEFLDSKGQNTSDPSSITDRTVVVNLDPRFYGGWSNTFQYKGFSLDFLFQFVKQIGGNYRFGNAPGAFNANQQTTVLNRWRKEGDIAEIQKISLGANAAIARDAVSASDAAYTDASFIRLKNAAFSYTFPTSSIKILSNTRVYVQGQNLITITRFEGTDPETQSVGLLPPLKMLTVGFQLTL